MNISSGYGYGIWLVVHSPYFSKEVKHIPHITLICNLSLFHAIAASVTITATTTYTAAHTQPATLIEVSVFGFLSTNSHLSVKLLLQLR